MPSTAHHTVNITCHRVLNTVHPRLNMSRNVASILQELTPATLSKYVRLNLVASSQHT